MHRIGGLHNNFTHHIPITILRQNERLNFGAHECSSMTEAVEKSHCPKFVEFAASVEFTNSMKSTRYRQAYFGEHAKSDPRRVKSDSFNSLGRKRIFRRSRYAAYGRTG